LETAHLLTLLIKGREDPGHFYHWGTRGLMRGHNILRRKDASLIAATVVMAAVAIMTALPDRTALAGTPSGPAASAQQCVSITGLNPTSPQATAATQPWTPQEMRDSIPLTPAALAKALARFTPAQRRALETQATGSAQAAGCARTSSLTSAPAVPAVDPGLPDAAEAPQTKSLTTGYRTIGKFFFRVLNFPFNCTATAINDQKINAARALVLTAAHCLVGDYLGFIYSTDDWAFAPGWHNNKAPYGMWQVKGAYYPYAWYHCVRVMRGEVCSNLDGSYDFGLLIVKPMHGHGVGWYVGDDGWRVKMPKTEKVTIFGVPGSSGTMLENATTSQTVTIGGFTYRKAATPNFGDGASGGPWFYSYNSKTQLGDILGDTGGYDAGGPTASPSYSPFWTQYFANFVAGIAAKE
jgi:hypothetical protein